MPSKNKEEKRMASMEDEQPARKGLSYSFCGIRNLLLPAKPFRKKGRQVK